MREATTSQKKQCSKDATAVNSMKAVPYALGSGSLIYAMLLQDKTLHMQWELLVGSW